MEIANWFRDPVWQFIGAFVTIGSLILYLLHRNRKRLSYQVQVTELLSVREDIKSKLIISYDEQRVENLHLVKLRVINSGNQPILPDDFESPIQIELDTKSEIFKAEVSNTKPKSLRPFLSIETRNIKIKPLLLNQGDWMTINILVGQLGKEINVQGRIAGVREISPVEPSRYLSVTKYGIYVLVGSMLFSVIYGVLKNYFPELVHGVVLNVLWVAFFLGIATILFGFIRFGQLQRTGLDS